MRGFFGFGNAGSSNSDNKSKSSNIREKGKAARCPVRRSALLENLEQRVLFSGYVVAPWGDDGGAGTLDSPWRTVQHAVDSVAAGDVVHLRGGTYDGGITISNKVVLRSYADEQAYIVAPNDSEDVIGAVTIMKEASGTRLVNLDISGGGYYTLKTDSNWDSGEDHEYGASNITVKNTRLHDSGRDVVKLTPGSDNVRFINVEIYNSGMRDPSNAEGIDAVNTDNLLVEDSYIHDIATNGIYAKGGSINTIIRRNYVENIGHSGIVLGQSSDENWFDTSVNPGYFESIGGLVRNNTVTNTQGAGIALWAAADARVFRNTLDNVAQTMMGGILITGQEHWIPDSVIIPSRNAAIARNQVQVFSDRPVLDIRESGFEGALNMANNEYHQGGAEPQFWDERAGFAGGLSAWQNTYQTDWGSVQI